MVFAMTRIRRARPTAAELQILQVLWSRGPSAVREVNTVLGLVKPAGYTTTLKLMQIMAEKGLVRRNRDGRAHLYEPAVPKGSTLRLLVGEFLDRAFEGSKSQLVMHALSAKGATAAEIAQIRQILDEYEQKKR
jgi:BlaI family penicillinase repressor